MNTPIGQLTTDGYDLQFGTNVVGHYLFTKRLMPLLTAGVQSSPDQRARIVHCSSSAQMFTNMIDFDAMKDVSALKKLGSVQMYMQSKFVSGATSKLTLSHHWEGGRSLVERICAAI